MRDCSPDQAGESTLPRHEPVRPYVELHSGCLSTSLKRNHNLRRRLGWLQDCEMKLALTALPFGTTLARQMARQNLTRFNHAFWVGERGFDHLAGGFSSITFPPETPSSHGIYKSEPEWVAGVNEHRIWTRQYVLVSAASLLEVYLNSVTTSALRAQPGLVDAALTGQDGYLYVMGKRPTPAGWNKALKTKVATFTKGLWKDRLKNLETVFGTLPAKAWALEAKLQELQQTRNDIAHEFGLDGPPRSAQWEMITHIEPSFSDCDKAIKAVAAMISAIDAPVFGPRIGGHEMLYQYHLWAQSNPSAGSWHVAGKAANLFRDYIGGLTSAPLGADYSKAIANYYHSL